MTATAWGENGRMAGAIRTVSIAWALFASICMTKPTGG